MGRGIAELVIGLGRGKPSPKDPKGPMGEDEPESKREHEEEGYEADEEQTFAGEDLAAAIQSGDGAKIAEAFKALMDLC